MDDPAKVADRARQEPTVVADPLRQESQAAADTEVRERSGTETKDLNLPAGSAARIDQGGAVYTEHVNVLVSQYLEVNKQTADLVRYVGFGLVAFFVAAANTSNGLSYRIVRDNEALLITAALCGCLVIAFDYANLAFRSSAQGHLLHLIDTNSPDLKRSGDQKHYLYDPKHKSYRFSKWCSVAKQIVAIVGSLLLVIVFSRTLIL